MPLLLLTGPCLCPPVPLLTAVCRVAALCVGQGLGRGLGPRADAWHPPLDVPMVSCGAASTVDQWASTGQLSTLPHKSEGLVHTPAVSSGHRQALSHLWSHKVGSGTCPPCCPPLLWGQRAGSPAPPQGTPLWTAQPAHLRLGEPGCPLLPSLPRPPTVLGTVSRKHVPHACLKTTGQP